MSNSGMPHYVNSTASMNNFEPVFLSTFNVLITPPALVDGWDFVLEQITKVSGMATDKLPGADVVQKFKGVDRRFSGNLPSETTVDIEVEFNVNINDDNSMYVYKAMRKWCDLIWNPLTGSRVLKKDYVGGPMIVSLYNRIGQVTRQWIFPTIWPIEPIPAMDLDYSDGSAIYGPLTMKFASDYWSDISQ